VTEWNHQSLESRSTQLTEKQKKPRLGIPVWGPNTKDEASPEEIEKADLAAWLRLVDEDEDEE
jgi:hypothetical protein